MEAKQTSKLQSAIYYALDGDQVTVLTMLSQRCEDPWVKITFFLKIQPNLNILNISDSFPIKKTFVTLGM